jgi:NAD+ synthase (glutamine-hydrolysing)
LSKPFLRKWLQWVEKVGPSDFGPIPALAEVNRLAPSAELRPLQEGQTDESDLMPYEVLEAIDEGIFRDRLPWKELWGRLQERFPGYPREQLAEWIGRFLTLCSQNQWKRDRMAPAFFVGDPQGATWTTRRLPLLSAGFTQELAELNPHP